MKRALVTGAGGFIGSHLTAALAASGLHVIANDRDCGAVHHLEKDGVEVIEGDVTDAEVRARCLEGVDTVYHLAAAHLSVTAGEDVYERVNVRGVAELIEDIARFGVRRLVHTSSVGVHGRLRRVPADESSPCEPELVYEKTKLRGEGVVLDACRGGDLSALILRPVWVYGPGCGRTERMIRAIRRGRFVVAGKGGARRHSIHIEDMVRAYVLAARAEASGEVVIVGDTVAPTVRELVNAIAHATESRPPRGVPFALIASAAVAAEIAFLPLGKEPPISRRTLRLFTANTSFDVAKSKRILGFEPEHDLDSGLARTVAALDARDPWRVECADYDTLAERVRTLV